MHNLAESLPPIMVSDADYDRLVELANAVSARNPLMADGLLAELGRAEIVGELPKGVVAMGSRVEYRSDGAVRNVTLVFPNEADIATGKVSIMTPIGTALIGLSEGQSMAWTARDGRHHELTVLRVLPPAG